MKRIYLVLIFLVAISKSALSADIETSENYIGNINSVAVGFFGHVGVGLPDGQTCHGQRVIVLLTTHPLFESMLSVLLTAEAAQKEVNVFQLGSQESDFGVGYCVITHVSLGDFPLW